MTKVFTKEELTVLCTSTDPTIRDLALALVAAQRSVLWHKERRAKALRLGLLKEEPKQ